MKSKIKRITIIRASIIALIISVMVAIFVLSAQVGEESGETSEGFTAFVLGIFGINEGNTSPEKLNEIEGIVRTLAHFSEYAALGFLSALLFLTYDIKRSLSLLYAVAFSAFYAMTDEIHQIFVPGRAAQISDFLVDTSGALFGSIMLLIAAAVAAFCAKQMKKPRKPKNTKTKKKITKKIF